MTALNDIRTALALALEGVDGLQSYTHVPPQVNVPAAVVAPDSITYDVDFEHGATYRLPVQFLVSLGDWGSAQKQLDTFVAHDGSVVSAINDSTLEAQVLEMTDYGLTRYADKDYLGAVLTVEVFV